ncbi:hypothetical protein [Microbacterium halotolerans]|uniref:hypothetical protein n=1 Tax=Microbacterium halotolerans TaxID=246613 RepID=UPI000E6ADB59|nr:hypothetical protein [Microbacterium halotolerans]
MECSTFLSPLIDPYDVLSDAIALYQDVAAWLPEAEVIWVYSAEHSLSTYARWMRARMEQEGLWVSTRGAVVGEHQRTRMVWHARSEGLSRPEGHFECDLRADRVREFIVETGGMFDGQLVADEVAAYKALMSFPS